MSKKENLKKIRQLPNERKKLLDDEGSGDFGVMFQSIVARRVCMPLSIVAPHLCHELLITIKSNSNK